MLNVEICQLWTAIHDESCNMESILHFLQMTDLALGSEVQQRWVLRQQVNARLLQHLNQTEHLLGFSG